MPINFIPNDPLAVRTFPMRQVTPRRNRPAGRAGFTFVDRAPQKPHAAGTAGFLFWQCREAALWSVQVWEGLAGPLTRWSPEAVSRTRLQLVQDAGEDLNAFYDRESLAFFRHTTGAKTTLSGASTDVVAHEAGHAFLDAIRPELFDSTLTESGAFHEAFGDCMAVLVALSDRDIRDRLLRASPTLSRANAVETWGEDLADGVKRSEGASHPAAAPRRLRNTLRFQLPTSLPTSGGPDVLTSEIHSFGRIFGGCFYDVIRNVFNASPTKDGAALLAASKIAGTLLVEAARQAPLSARFFQSVGRAMVLADDATHGGAHRAAIGQAFAAHGVLLGSSSALMPKVSLAGAAPSARPAAGATRGAAAPLDASTLRDLRRRIDASPSARFAVTPVTMGGERFVEAVHQREVDLSALGPMLRGVVALAPETIVIGGSGRAAAAFSTLPDATSTGDEVLKFVETLLAHDRIDVEPARAARTRGAVTRSRGVAPRARTATHVVRTIGGRQVLTRVRFLCGGH